MKIKRQFKPLVMFVFIVLVSNCSLQPSTWNGPTNNVTLSPTDITARLPKKTSTNVPTITVSVPIISEERISGLRMDCIPTTLAQELDNIQETIVTFGSDNQLKLWYPSSGQEKYLGRVKILTSALSNNQALAYIDDDFQQVIIVSPDGETMESLPASEHWVEVLDWIGNDKLLISNMTFNSGGGWDPPSSTIVLELGTGDMLELIPNYPNIYIYASGPPKFGRYGYSITAYDPTLTRVVYPSSILTGEFLILWDITGQQEISRLESLFPWSEPVWNGDGSAFIVSIPPQYIGRGGNVHRNVDDSLPYLGGSELFKVSRDGELERLTHFATEFVAEQRSYSWSPDNQSIVFWLKTRDNPQWTLVRLNRITGEMTDYCVDGGPDASHNIYWLPGGNRILTTLWFAEGDKRALLVDFDKKTATLMRKNESIIGWMVDNPSVGGR